MKPRRILSLLILAATALAAQDRAYVLKARRMFDSVAGKIVEPGVIVVADGKIQAVGASNAPAGVQVIDLGDATLLPGFIDAHTHLTMDFDPDYSGAQLRGLQRTTAETAIRSTANARVTLMAGFTTVRNVGANDFVDVGLRNSIDAGIVPGPKMLISLHAIGSTGGHCDDSDSFRAGVFNHESGPQDGVINNADEARFAVRYNIKYGADVIKICASGGVLSPTDEVDVPQFTQAELDALVDEAHTLRKKIAAHSHGAESSKRAIRAGIDSIEHGTFLDDEGMRMMHDRGTYLVPTLTVRTGLAESKFPPLVRAKADRAVQQQDTMVRRAVQLGVKIALGTDATVFPHGNNAIEFQLMAADGLTTAQSLQAGTIAAADLLGLKDKVGVLKPGMVADIVAVPGDPVSDIKTTQSVFFVMKAGKIFRNDRAK